LEERLVRHTVNVASRLQSLTRELKTPLVVADAVVRQINGGRADGSIELPIALQDRGHQELRGRSGAIGIWTKRAGA
jgi:class 3 adenylate cyclase